MEQLPDWQDLLLWTGALSATAIIATIVAVPWVVRRLPDDYFARDERIAWNPARGAPLLGRVVGVVKNLLGSALVVFGLIMLVTPGQGVLTVLAGLLLMNFPGKYKLERWLVMQPGVMRGLNWLRRRAGKAAFILPP